LATSLAHHLLILIAEEEGQLISVARAGFPSAAALIAFGFGQVALTALLAVSQDRSDMMAHQSSG
jgi:hypothetical protein